MFFYTVERRLYVSHLKENLEELGLMIMTKNKGGKERY